MGLSECMHIHREKKSGQLPHHIEKEVQASLYSLTALLSVLKYFIERKLY